MGDGFDMSSLLIYISYDRLAYMNYFHLAADNTFVETYIDEEQKLLSLVGSQVKEKNDITCCVVKDIEATDWDAAAAFDRERLAIKKQAPSSIDGMLELLEGKFGGNFQFVKMGEDTSGKMLEVICSGVLSRKAPGMTELLDMAENILSSDSQEKSELAKIIEEKYGRMVRHE